MMMSEALDEPTPLLPGTLIDIPLEQIKVGEGRARRLDETWVHALAKSILNQGLLSPISVRHIGDGFRLVHGNHRLAAFRLLGVHEIPCILSAAASDEAALLEEVMENLCRNELRALDRCHHMYLLKQAWEKLHPNSTKGGNKNVKKGKENKGKTKQRKPSFGGVAAEDMPTMWGFAAEMAHKIGLGQTQIRQCIYIWTHLVPTARERLQDMALADKMTELKALADLSAARQLKVLDVIADAAIRADNVAEALAHLDGVPPKSLEIRRYETARDAIAKMSDQTLDQLVLDQSDKIIAALTRQGKI
jgi:ParB family transcriptional regulator, chromosome partitioning protein